GAHGSVEGVLDGRRDVGHARPQQGDRAEVRPDILGHPLKSDREAQVIELEVAPEVRGCGEAGQNGQVGDASVINDQGVEARRVRLAGRQVEMRRTGVVEDRPGLPAIPEAYGQTRLADEVELAGVGRRAGHVIDRDEAELEGGSYVGLDLLRNV